MLDSVLQSLNVVMALCVLLSDCSDVDVVFLSSDMSTATPRSNRLHYDGAVCATIVATTTLTWYFFTLKCCGLFWVLVVRWWWWC